MKWNGCFGLKPRLHTHKEHEPKFLSLLHTSCVRDCRSTQIHIYIYRNLFKVLRPVRGPAKTLHCVLLKDSSLIVAFGVGPKINIPSSSWVLVRPPYCHMPVVHAAFYPFSYIFAGGRHGQFRSNKPVNSSLPCPLWTYILIFNVWPLSICITCRPIGTRKVHKYSESS